MNLAINSQCAFLAIQRLRMKRNNKAYITIDTGALLGLTQNRCKIWGTDHPKFVFFAKFDKEISK